MVTNILLLSLAALGLFYFQNIMLFTQVYLLLPELLIIYATLRHPLVVAVCLALWLGLLQDSYALTPLGCHILAALLVVAVTRGAKSSFLLQHPVSQILVSAVALLLESLGLLVILLIVGIRESWLGEPVNSRLLEIFATAVLAPLCFSILKGVETLAYRWNKKILITS